jgi:hypothetical protein
VSFKLKTTILAALALLVMSGTAALADEFDDILDNAADFVTITLHNNWEVSITNHSPFSTAPARTARLLTTTLAAMLASAAGRPASPSRDRTSTGHASSLLIPSPRYRP